MNLVVVEEVVAYLEEMAVEYWVAFEHLKMYSIETKLSVIDSYLDWLQRMLLEVVVEAFAFLRKTKKTYSRYHGKEKE